MFAIRRACIECKLGIMQRDHQRIRSVLMSRNAEFILFDEIVNGDGALMLLIRAAAPDRRFIERYRYKPAFAASLVHRSPQIEADGDGSCMCIETFGQPQRNGMWSQLAQAFGRAFQDRSALHEIE